MESEASPQPLVSVITPAFNAAATLAETLASIRGQTYRNLEILVVDDGSADQTAMLAEAAARSDPRVRVLRQPNAGVAAARNLALDAARGLFVAPLDADDLWAPDKIERQVRRAREQPGAGAIYCWSVEIDSDSRVIERRLDQDEVEGDVFAALVLSNFIGNASVLLVRRDLALAVGGWDRSLRARGAEGCEDWLFYLRLAARTRFALEPAFLVGYRQTPGAMSRQLGRMERSFRLVLEEASRHRPRPPGRLLRWSRSEFAFYLADLLLERGARLAALRQIAIGTLMEPPVARLRSYRRRLRRVLGIVRDVPDGVRGAPFESLSPERDLQIRDGATRDRKRAEAARLRLGPA